MPWDKLARSLIEQQLDPDVLFRWPIARVFAVFLLDASSRPQPLSRAEIEERVNAARAAKGLPPLPSRKPPKGRR